MYAGYTIPQLVWFGLIGVLSFSIVISLIKAYYIGKGSSGAADVIDTVQVHCASCGWKGEVPRLRKKCPMCGDNNFID